MKLEKNMIIKGLKSKFLLILLVFFSKISFSQKGLPVNNEFLKIKLKNIDKNIFLQFKNTTKDTIYLRNIFFLENETTNSYILSFEKKYDSIVKDTLYEQGFLMNYNIDAKHVLNTSESIIKIPPRTIRDFFIVHIFRNGIYFFKVKTFYIYRKKYFYIDTITNEIVVE